jgi:ketosteroid isomerase-like protein
MDTTPAHRIELPEAIAAYQTAHDRRDVPTALAQFADDATVVDDGHTYEGIAGVESFLRTAAGEYTFTRDLVAAEERAPGRWLVTNHLHGDFPGGDVDLDYEFHLTDGVITRLTIAP